MIEAFRRGLLLLALASVGCKAPSSEPPSRPAPTALHPENPPEVSDRDPSYRLPAPDRLVAIGDIHGDLEAFHRALRVAGATDEHGRWTGGKLVVVQTGDQIDRGDDDRAVIELTDQLKDVAVAAGGRFVSLIGNHEAMNVNGDLRYVTPGGAALFADVDTSRTPPSVLAQFPAEQRGRVAAFQPGGPFARRFAERDVVAMAGGTVFVHGGVTLGLVRYGIGRINRETRAWMNGNGPMPFPVKDPDGPLWTRRYSEDDLGIDCAGLAAALDALGAKRMVVGHTPQRSGITNACDGKVWRIDTGLSRHYGGPTEVLEIRGDAVAVLRAPR